MHVIGLKREERVPWRTWGKGSVILGLLAMWWLVACGAQQTHRSTQAEAAISVPSATPALRPVPTFTPTPAPSLTPLPPTAAPGVDGTEKALSESTPAAGVSGRVERLQPSGDTLSYKTSAGTYDSLAEHWEGSYVLEQWGSTIGAVFSTTRSPVQYSAHQIPEPLFTVPADFRPALDIAWEIEGWPVNDEGKGEASHAEPHLFTLRVTKDGTVQYQDNAPFDSVSYVRYTARLAWPRAGISPNVCERHYSMKWALVAILHLPDPDSPPACAGITWEQLATIKDLTPPTPFGSYLGYVKLHSADDLAGLQAVTKAKIANYRRWPAGVLVPVPQLETLNMSSGSISMDGNIVPPSSFALPEDLLVYTPKLQELRLEAVAFDNFRDGFLDSVPRLRILHLKNRLPRLHTLTWPAHIQFGALLKPVPALTELYLDLGTQMQIPRDLLTPVPELKVLTLAVPRGVRVPEDLLDSVPRLESLTLVLQPQE